MSSLLAMKRLYSEINTKEGEGINVYSSLI